jgi:hypothetical protein
VSVYGLDDRAIEVRSSAEEKEFFLYPLCPEGCMRIVTAKINLGRSDKLSSYLNKEVTVRFGKLKMQLWDSMC